MAVPTPPLQLGLKLFQSVQPALSTARLPSASSKPVASASVPEAPQPLDAASVRPIPAKVVSKAGKKAGWALAGVRPAARATELEAEDERETREACPEADDRCSDERRAVRAAEWSPEAWRASKRPEAAPKTSAATRPTAIATIAPIRVGRPRVGRRTFPRVLIASSRFLSGHGPGARS